MAGQCYYDRKSGTLVVVSPLLLNIHRHKQSVGADHVSLPARKEITPSGKLFILTLWPLAGFLPSDFLQHFLTHRAYLEGKTAILHLQTVVRGFYDLIGLL